MAKKENTRGILRRKGRKAGRKSLPTGSAEIAAAALLGTLVASEVDANLKNSAGESAAVRPQDAGSRPEGNDVAAQQSREQSDLNARREILRDQERGLPDETAGSDEAQSEQTAEAATEADLAALEGMEQPAGAVGGFEQVVEGAGEEPVHLADASAGGTATDAAPAGAQGATDGDPASAETGGAMSPGAPNAAMVAAGAVGVIGIAALAAGGGGSGGVVPAVLPPIVAAGAVVDGKVSGATVFADFNKNGIRDADEPQTTTNASGGFNLGVTVPEGTIIVSFGGTDLFTGRPAGTMIAVVDRDGNTIVNPIATLFAFGVTQTQFFQQTGFNINPRDIDVDALLQADRSIEDRNLGEDLFTLQMQIQTIISAAVTLRVGETGSSAAAALIVINNAMAGVFAAGGDPSTLLSRLTAAAVGAAGADAATAAAVIAAINNVLQEIEDRFDDLAQNYTDATANADARAIGIIAQTALLTAITDAAGPGTGDLSTLNTIGSDSGLTALVTAIRGDLNGAVQNINLTDEEAASVLDSGISFEASDDVQVTATGTHVEVTLKDLRLLGADRVVGDETVAPPGQNDLAIDLGAGEAIGGTLPQFEDALEVQLNITDAQIAEVVGGIGSLDAANVDHLHLVDGNADISETQAQQIANAGIDFATGDDITVHAEGTSMSTTLKNLGDIGADQVAQDVDGADAATANGGRDIVLSLGFTTANEAELLGFLEANFEGQVFTGTPDPVVQLNVADQATFDAIRHNDEIVGKMIEMGIDLIGVSGQPNSQEDLHNL